MLISFAFLIVPIVCEQYGEFRITAYFPSSLMRGEYIWSAYRPVYLAGTAVNEQWLIGAAIIISVICTRAAVRIFERHEASN